MFLRKRKNFDGTQDFREMKNFIMLYVWQILNKNREEVFLGSYTNQGYTKDDGATLISMIVNYLFAEKQANELDKGSQKVKDFAAIYINMAIDMAQTILRNNENLKSIVCTVLQRQLDIRTEQYGTRYKTSDEGKSVIAILNKFNPEDDIEISQEDFIKFVNGLALSSNI